MNAPERPPTSGLTPIRTARGVLWAVDKATNALALSALAAIVVVITWTVFGRFVLQQSPGWGPEVALVLLGWIGFLGIAIGVRENGHIAVTFVVDRLPRPARRVIGLLTPLAFLVFGAYLVVQGWDFTQSMMRNTLPATGLPTGVQYAAMPVSGVLISVYSVLHLFSIDTRRYVDTDPDPTEGTQSEVEAASKDMRVEGEHDR